MSRKVGDLRIEEDEIMMSHPHLLNYIRKLMPLQRHLSARAEERAREAAALMPPDPETGLTAEAVEERKALGLINSAGSESRSVAAIVFSHLFTWFNFLNLILGCLVFSTGRYQNMLFLGVVISNSLIGIVQELKVRSQIRSLRVITAEESRVLRDGVLQMVPVGEVVKDDILSLETGDQIIADGPVLTSFPLEINESLLTGESKPVPKKAGDRLLSGSFVASGQGVMRAEKVGGDAYAATLVRNTSRKGRASSEMQDTIRRVIRIVSATIVPVGLLLYRSQRAAASAAAAAADLSDGWVYGESVVRTVSGVIGMIPEGLVLLTSVSFIIGVGRLARKKALVQEMEAIEALARADILCLDKTGTITTGDLKVRKLITVGDVSAAWVRSVMAHMGGTAGAHTGGTQTALDRYFGIKKDWPVSGVIPFSSDRKFAAAAFPEFGSFVIGAPEFLVPDRADVLGFVQKYAAGGCRCLLLCESEGIFPETGEAGILSPLAVIVISDVIRQDATETFAFFARSASPSTNLTSSKSPAGMNFV